MPVIRQPDDPIGKIPPHLFLHLALDRGAGDRLVAFDTDIARFSRRIACAATGFGSLMFSLLLAWSVPADAHSWRDVLVSLAVVPAAALGGYIAARLNARATRQSMKEMP